MIYYIFLLLFLFLSFVGDKPARGSCFMVFAFSCGFTLVDNAMLKHDYQYLDHVFVALCFCFALVYSLIHFVESKVANRQAIALVGAMIIHTLMIIDIKVGASIVYDSYEKLLLFITIVQMAVSNDKFIDAITDSFERVLLLLYGRHFYSKNSYRLNSETKDGAFRV